MTNPYTAPRDSEVDRDISVGHRSSLLSVLAASTGGGFISLACGMATCWIKGGWLGHQLLLPIERWRLPMYFWFHCGAWFFNALVLSLLVLPLYLYLRRSFHVLRLMCFVFAICTIATVGFEAYKSYPLIEPPTHALIVLVLSYALLLPLCFVRLWNRRMRGTLPT